MSNTSNLLSVAWQREQVPLLNGILFPDGRHIRLEWDGDHIVVGSSGSSWDENDLRDEVTYFTELSRAKIPNSELVVIAGEGGLGADGVIALVDTNTDLPCWVLFMDSSNPFSHVEVVDGQIVASTTLGKRWRIDPLKPGLLAVTD